MSAPVRAGDVLDGKYAVERVLGTGGMGMVVAARHVDLGQRVALKFMLKEAMADPANVERFAREARAAVQLLSPHTARVLDVGKLHNGEPYMVMEYLEGEDLDALVQNGPLRPDVAVEYMLQACEAFAEAHAKGIVHRDIKLKNLFLTKSIDGRALVKVLDFGLAKTLGSIGDVALTATSNVFGSPQYMSPEQMRSAKEVDARSDIWSIGVCLYELLAGRLPFDAPGVAEICAMVLKDPTPPLRQFAPVPAQLEAIVLRCLEKDAQRRYQSVAELAAALEPFTHFEGSSRRILNVMQTASRPIAALPTASLGPLPSSDEIAKTISTWDSDHRARPMVGKPSATLGVVVGLGAATLIIVGVLVGKTLMQSKTDAARTTSEPLAAPIPEPATPLTPAAPEPEPAVSATASHDGTPGPEASAAAKRPSHAGPGSVAPRPPFAPTTAGKPVTTTPKKTAKDAL
jgi:eukaryotic-like serine/threonine-protein kinase